jgi:hypothetical protein
LRNRLYQKMATFQGGRSQDFPQTRARQSSTHGRCLDESRPSTHKGQNEFIRPRHAPDKRSISTTRFR